MLVLYLRILQGFGVHSDNDDDSYNHSGYSSPSGYDGGKPSQSSDIDILAIVTGLKEQCDPAIALLAKADTVDVVTVQVAAIVGLVKTACSSLFGVTVNVAADVKVKIAQCVVDLIVAIITACAAVTVKLGASVCLALWAQIDVCLHLLLLTLHACVDGLLKLIINLCLNLDVTILAKLNILDLQLCVKILGLAAKLAGLGH
ncbi:hypothetical protein CTheo_8756 [Ceratobasidium theobromae]|uniref:Uncharacterized protein n=1 Tax=Ceratobasidium theobromae TaxID=1582974 RepID=A0A5N5Q7Q1_9AGAM|nr:hypothetical protein CTheo_8756 [Ceratobasidium theobromae]